MTRLNSLILGSALAVGLIGLAHADGAVTGAWKLSVGANDAPCVVTFTADTDTAGTATTAGDCSKGGDEGKWETHRGPLLNAPPKDSAAMVNRAHRGRKKQSN